MLEIELKDFKFNGFKLYKHYIKYNDVKFHDFNYIFQYKNGLVANIWRQYINNESDDTEWEIGNWLIYNQEENLVFIRNLNEEEVFILVL